MAPTIVGRANDGGERAQRFFAAQWPRVPHHSRIHQVRFKGSWFLGSSQGLILIGVARQLQSPDLIRGAATPYVERVKTHLDHRLAGVSDIGK